MIKEFTIWQAQGVASKLQFQSVDGTIRGEVTTSPEQVRSVLNGQREARFEASFDFGVLTLHRHTGGK